MIILLIDDRIVHIVAVVSFYGDSRYNCSSCCEQCFESYRKLIPCSCRESSNIIYPQSRVGVLIFAEEPMLGDVETDS